MTRMCLLGAAALACLSTQAGAQSTITGGGSVTGRQTVVTEQHKFNGGSGPVRLPGGGDGPGATFDTYWAAGSGVGQLAFLSDDLSCDINAVTGGNGGECSGKSGMEGNTVIYAASDIVFSKDQIGSWATSAFGQHAAGDLIQLPSLGAGVAIAVTNTAIRGNGALTLSDDDLCGVFSGQIADFGQITDSATQPAPGPITVYYSTAAEGPTFWLTDHLAAVCSAGSAAITFTPTTNFASLFPGRPPDNFVPEPGSQAIADAMAGCDGAPVPALGYLTPDYTSIDAKSGVRLGCKVKGGSRSQLVVAGLIVNDVSFTPTVPNIVLGLTHAVLGNDLVPPGNAKAGADPAAWAPLVQTVSEGYPIVGYISFDLAQCYADMKVSTSFVGFLDDLYTANGYAKIANANGFATQKQLAATGYLKVIEKQILKPGPWQDGIEDPIACRSVTGR